MHQRNGSHSHLHDQYHHFHPYSQGYQFQFYNELREPPKIFPMAKHLSSYSPLLVGIVDTTNVYICIALSSRSSQICSCISSYWGIYLPRLSLSCCCNNFNHSDLDESGLLFGGVIPQTVSRIDLIRSFVRLLLLVSFALYITIASDNYGLNLSISANSFSRAILFRISSDLPIECWSSSPCSSNLMRFGLLMKHE
jgi:hypothetical protein